MTRLGFERHVPDLALITYYSELQDSIVHRFSPWTKIVILPILIFNITIITDSRVLALIFVTVVFVYWISKLPIITLFFWWTLPVFFVLSLAILLIWTVPGTPLIHSSFITLTRQGLTFLLNLLLKALIGVTYSLTLIMTTRYNYQSYIVSKILPYPLDQIILLTYRFIFLTLDGLEWTIISMKARGGFTIAGLKKSGRFYGSVFASTFIRSFDRAEHISKAMASRGYKGQFQSTYSPPKPSFAGYFTIVLLLIASCYVSITGGGL